MKLNTTQIKTLARTHEGAPAVRLSSIQQLRRSVSACLLWEDSFYEDGVSIAERISSLVPKCHPLEVASLALEAREKLKLRHVPLLLVRELARTAKGALVGDTLASVIQRPDELAEFLAIYWKEKKQPLSAQVKKGLAKAFLKFNEYSLAKYNRDGAIKLRDVLFLCHAKPENEEQEKLFRKVVDNKLETPDTWETNLSAGADKKSTFERLIVENKLGALAFLRNLRNMQEAGVDSAVIKAGLLDMKVERVLPFRFITAARYAPNYEYELEQTMFKSLEGAKHLPGHTLLMIDVSGSMNSAISSKSETLRTDAANGLAILLRELCESVTIVTFSDKVAPVPNRRGFALRDAVQQSQSHSGTYLGAAVNHVAAYPHDRIIVITDEQSADAVPNPRADAKGYIVNVAAEQHGVGGKGRWNLVSGWSEAIVNYIQRIEEGE